MGGEISFDQVFLNYAAKMNVIPAEKIADAKKKVPGLAKFGLKPNLFKMLVYMKLLDNQKFKAVATEVEKIYKLAPPAFSDNRAKDAILKTKVTPEQLKQCTDLRAQLLKQGFDVPLYDLAVSRGMLKPSVVSPLTARKETSKKQKIIFFSSIGGVVLLIAIFAIVMLTKDKNKGKQQPDQVAKVEETKKAAETEEKKAGRDAIMSAKTDKPKPAAEKKPVEEEKKTEEPTQDTEKPAETANTDNPQNPENPTPATDNPTPTPTDNPTDETAKPPKEEPQKKPQDPEAGKPPKNPNDPPADPFKQPESEKQKELKNLKAKELLAQADGEFNLGSFDKAVKSYRKLLSEYTETETVLTNLETINDHIRICTNKLIAGSLTSAKISKAMHSDPISAITFNPPDGWRGVPPQLAYKRAGVGEDLTVLMDKGDPFPRGAYLSPFSNNVYLQIVGIAKVMNLDECADFAVKNMKKQFEAEADGDWTDIRGNFHMIRRQCFKKDGYYYINYSIYGEKRGVAMVVYWKGFDSSCDVKPLTKLFDDVCKSVHMLSAAAISDYTATYGRVSNTIGWKTLTTQHFQIQSNMDDKLVKRFSEHLEAIYNQYLQVFKSLTKKPPLCPVKFFAGPEEFYFYSNVPQGVAGYFSPAQGEIVGFLFNERQFKLRIGDSEDTAIVSKGDIEEQGEVTFKIMYHEVFHWFADQWFGAFDRDLEIPSWFNEGTGDYFFGGKLRKGRMEIGPNSWRVKKIYEAVKDNKHVSIETLFKYKKSDYYSNATMCYAEGWSIVYFILSNRQKYPAYGSAYLRLCDLMAKKNDGVECTAEAFKGIDLKKFEEQWKEFVLDFEKKYPELVHPKED